MNDDVKDIIDNLGADAHRFAGKTVLIAGGAGFLGRHFLAVFKRLNKEVLAKPCRVISADNYITGDQVIVHGAPTSVDFGKKLVCQRRATVVRASVLDGARARLAGYLELTELYEVSFSDGRAQ